MGLVKKPVKARPATNACAKAKAEPRAEPQRIQVICETLLCGRENQPGEAVGGIRTCCHLCSGSNSQRHTTLCQEHFERGGGIPWTGLPWDVLAMLGLDDAAEKDDAADDAT